MFDNKKVFQRWVAADPAIGLLAKEEDGRWEYFSPHAPITFKEECKYVLDNEWAMVLRGLKDGEQLQVKKNGEWRDCFDSFDPFTQSLPGSPLDYRTRRK